MSMMSHRTRGSATPSSILKKPRSYKVRPKETKQTPVKVRFVLPHSQKVQNILEEYVSTKQSRDYENILCLIRDAELTDEDVLSLLKEATDCISLLSKELKLFVEALLSIEWLSKRSDVVKEYQTFIVNLVAAHNYHAKMVIDRLVKLFIPGPEELEWPEGQPTDIDRYKCMNLHSLMKLLLEVIPMSKELLFNSVTTQFPYYNKPTHMQEYYIFNLLQIIEYQPKFRPDLLRLLFSKLVTMDVNAPREEIKKTSELDEEVFAFDDDAKSVRTSTTSFTQVDRHALGHTLDTCLNQLFEYFTSECYKGDGELDWEKTKNIFFEMMTVFDQVILPTHDTHHVQFIMFFICSFKSTLTDYFLTFLWKKVCNPNVAPIFRQSAVNYIASFVARANFVPLQSAKVVLQGLSQWIHDYINTQDELGMVNSDVRVHRVFYSVCQALFYIVVFRHKDFVHKRKGIRFLERLNMGRIVTSRLNPLRVCQPAIVQNFAAVTRNYQLAYCYSVIEHNSRNTMPVIYQNEQGAVMVSNNILEAIFPFDPLVLEKSNMKIANLYREYQEFSEEPMEVDVTESTDTTDVDDFLRQELSTTPTKSHIFSYSNSPGFKFNG